MMSYTIWRHSCWSATLYRTFPRAKEYYLGTTIHNIEQIPQLIRESQQFQKRSTNDFWRPGPSCSKLMTLLVNETLTFQTLISQKYQYFLLKKCEKLLKCKSFSHFFQKNISVLGYKVVKHLTSWPLNELVKLKMLWTTGSCMLIQLIWFANYTFSIPVSYSTNCNFSNWNKCWSTRVA